MRGISEAGKVGDDSAVGTHLEYHKNNAVAMAKLSTCRHGVMDNSNSTPINCYKVTTFRVG